MSSATPDYLTTAEVAELLRIKERKVYDMVSSEQIPCTRATGKLLFPRREILAWLIDSSSPPIAAQARRDKPPVFLGSHDPLMDWALKESGCGLASNFDGSIDGIERFAAGEGIATSLHLYDAASEQWNVPGIANRFEYHPVVLSEFCWRERGLVLRAEDRAGVQSVADLTGLRIAPRQQSAGSQVLLNQLIEKQGMQPGELEFTDTAYTETDAVTSVLDGSADVTLGLKSIAGRFGLEFVPLLRERFDLLVDRRAWFEPAFQGFLAFCHSAPFRQRAESLPGYDVSGFGRIHFNG